MKKSVILIITILFAFLCVSASIGFFVYTDGLKPVDDEAKENITFTVNKGDSTSTIIKNLKNENLIKNELVLKIYAKLNPGNLQAGNYVLTKAMSAKEIYDSLVKGKVTFDTVFVTFVEGKRLTYIADVISKNFDFTIDEINAKLDNKEYIKNLIEKYDFLTDDILKDGIYHPLEGYLFPDTYEFLKTVTLEEIIERMLDNTAIKLSKYTNNIGNANMTIHEVITLASIVELEGARSTDRKGVAGVFYNRLKNNMRLESDVTTYYAVNKDFSKDLTVSELASCNGYNTRGNCVKGLPIGPIATFSAASLDATINPSSSDYLFFVADKNGKTYFSKTYAEHEATVSKLKSNGLWFQY